MSKFESLCKAYANARKEFHESSAACQNFSEIFVRRMGTYLGCSVEYQLGEVDERSAVRFYSLLTVYANPRSPESSEREDVRISLSVERVIDNYIVTVDPWGKEFKLFWDEFDKFEEVYDYIFDRLLETYTCGFEALPPEKQQIRNLGWGF